MYSVVTMKKEFMLKTRVTTNQHELWKRAAKINDPEDPNLSRIVRVVMDRWANRQIQYQKQQV